MIDALLYQAGSAAEDMTNVIFYDWDGVTLLGVCPVPKGEDATEAVERWTQGRVSPLSKDKDPAAAKRYVDDPKYPLSGKEGYTFCGWLPLESKCPIRCGAALDENNSAITVAEPRAEDLQDFTRTDADLKVKACYTSNDELVWEGTIPAYTVEVVRYWMIGSVYMLRVRYRRKNPRGGVGPKMLAPIVVCVQQNSEGKVQYLYFTDITNGDEFDVDIPAAPVMCAKVDCGLVEGYGRSIGANAAKSQHLYENLGTMGDPTGYRYKCILGRTNDEIRKNALVFTYAPVLIRELGIVMENMDENILFGWLRAAWEKKNSTDGTGAVLLPEAQWRDLTVAELQHAVDHAGGWVAGS